jgi:hypothetical protein
MKEAMNEIMVNRKAQLKGINEILILEKECVQDIAAITGKLSAVWEKLAKGAKIWSDSMARLAIKLEKMK